MLQGLKYIQNGLKNNKIHLLFIKNAMLDVVKHKYKG